MRRRMLLPMLLAGFFALSAQAGVAEKPRRIALVIGEASYNSLPKLRNSVRDAEAMASALRGAGFDEVELLTDANGGETKRALDRFRGATQAGVKLIFFAGSGFGDKGAAFLAPVDVERASPRNASVPLAEFISAAGGATQLSALIIDACLEEIGAGQPASAASLPDDSLQTTRGGDSEIVAFAACGSGAAQDGPSGGHSPYTAALLRNMFVEGTSLATALSRAQGEVVQQTRRSQRPCFWASGDAGAASLSPQSASER